jgi:peroxiredoxin
VKAAGGELVAISPQTARHSREFAVEKGLVFPVLHDPGNAVAERYGLTWTLPEGMRDMYRGWGIDLTEYNGDDSWVLPIPARFIVDAEGITRYAEADPDYMTRPEPRETLEALRSL